MRHFSISILFTAASCLTSCLFENDMSYPRVDMDIVSFEVEGQVSANIDTDRRHIDVVLGEEVDMSHVKVISIETGEGTSLKGGMPEYLDLREEVSLTVEAYVEAVWTVSASQPVERYIKVGNQIGEAEIDAATRSATVYVSSSQSLKTVLFNDVKLEPYGSEVISTTGTVTFGTSTREETVPCSFPMTLECVSLRNFTVAYEDELYEWVVRVLQKEISVQVTSVNSWATHAYVAGMFGGEGNPRLEYRMSGTQEWTPVDEAIIEGVGISAYIKDLSPETLYEVRVVCDENESAPYEFETEEAAQIPNMNFDSWYAADPSAAKAVWYPYDKAGVHAWDSANPGAAAFIGSSTTPETGFVVSGKAARLESKYAVIAFAAGNIYTGSFGRIAGIGAELDWGYGFSSRPKALKGYYSYSPKPIDRTDGAKLSAGGMDADKLKGTMDRCQILVILADWPGPFHVNTNTGQFVDVENDEHIIAYAMMESDKATDGYEEFTLELEYRDNVRKPTYAVISACASYLGDYFTGGVGSVMYVDEFEFLYQ